MRSSLPPASQHDAGRAALIRLLADYTLPWSRVTLLEIQKLAYSLQVAGQPLKLGFVKGKYGPHAENLHDVLQRVAGHFVRGYGDRTRTGSIQLLAGAAEKAGALLSGDVETLARLKRVSELIEGFETPHRLELLATLHWLADSEGCRSAFRTDVDQRSEVMPISVPS